jgi:N-acetylglutamate synthase-like GNAT family acetyltransferase
MGSRTVRWDELVESPEGERSFIVRSFASPDQPHVVRLYHEGLLAGHIDPFDVAEDLEQIEEFYLRRPHRHFWVAEVGSEVVGTVAIATDPDGVGHLRRLRVTPNLPEKNRVAVTLVKTALSHAREWGAIKLAFHAPVDDARAIRLLGHLGFQFTRAREIRGRHLLEFYVDLYNHLRPSPPADEQLKAIPLVANEPASPEARH